MDVIVTGSSGMVGAALVERLMAGGNGVRRLVRAGGNAVPGTREVSWRPEAGGIDRGGLEGADAVVHLAGESIAQGRWTAEKKARIRDSRVRGTRLLAEALAGLKRRPRVLVSASAVGFYGSRGDEPLDESSALGPGFLADVCREWETATRSASEAGIRVVNLRLGFVLSRRGGGLARMLPPFRLGLGGRVGDGRQWMSFIALDDLLAAILHAITTESLRGPVNAVAPEPVTNAQFTKALGRALGRPTLLPMPLFAARAAFGEMADELLLASQRARPARLVASGFAFAHPTIDSALRQALRG